MTLLDELIELSFYLKLRDTVHANELTQEIDHVLPGQSKYLHPSLNHAVSSLIPLMLNQNVFELIVVDKSIYNLVKF